MCSEHRIYQLLWCVNESHREDSEDLNSLEQQFARLERTRANIVLTGVQLVPLTEGKRSRELQPDPREHKVWNHEASSRNPTRLADKIPSDSTQTD